MRAVLAMLCIVIAGCASQARNPEPSIAYAADGAVQTEMVDAGEGADRYQQVPGSSYLGPAFKRENALPVYPPELLDRLLPPVAVVARVIVDGTGSVTHVEVTENSSTQAAFADAVQNVAGGWRFYPLQRVTSGQVESLPFTQDYRFTFRQENGRAVVEAR